MDLEWPVTVGLCLAALLAGFVDAVAGGGGLIQVPALFAVLADPATALGVNKVASICGTSAAVARYAREGHVAWRRVALAGPIALVASWLAANGLISAAKEAADAIRPLFAGCFLALAAHQVWKALRATEDAAAPPALARPAVGLAFVAAIGLYDGFVGPGTGMFLFWTFTTWFALSALDATGTTKAVNWLTNAGALVAFLSRGAILWPLALSMAAANTLGGFLGARTAIRRGVRFIRLVTALVSVAASVYLLGRWARG